jgi:hypothetical protein
VLIKKPADEKVPMVKRVFNRNSLKSCGFILKLKGLLLIRELRRHKSHLGDIGVNGRIILKWTSTKQTVRVRTGCNWNVLKSLVIGSCE